MSIELVQVNTETHSREGEFVETKGQFLRRAGEWFDNHGTGFRDYDEFHARFTPSQKAVDDEAGHD